MNGTRLAARERDTACADIGLGGWWRRELERGGVALTAFLVEFDAGSFRPAAFGIAGVALPDGIARSVGKRQAEFFFGRLAARRALEHCSVAACEVPIGATREPIWPHGIIGSISHVDNLAAAVVLPRAGCRGIGIDLERVVDAAMLGTLRATALDSVEYALLSKHVVALPLEVLATLAFSAKESFFKGCFEAVGRYFDFSAAHIVAFDIQAHCLRLELKESLCHVLEAGRVFDLYFEFVEPGMVLTYFIW